MSKFLGWIAWLLRLLGLSKIAAFLEGGQQGLAAHQQEAQAEAEAIQSQIVQETQDEIAQVPGKTDSELVDDAFSLGLVRREGDSPGSGGGQGSGP